MMIGVIVSAVLHGVCLLQAFYYFQRTRSAPTISPVFSTHYFLVVGYKKDPFFMKALVSIFLLFQYVSSLFVFFCVKYRHQISVSSAVDHACSDVNSRVI